MFEKLVDIEIYLISLFLCTLHKCDFSFLVTLFYQMYMKASYVVMDYTLFSAYHHGNL